MERYQLYDVSIGLNIEKLKDVQNIPNIRTNIRKIRQKEHFREGECRKDESILETCSSKTVCIARKQRDHKACAPSMDKKIAKKGRVGISI
jgi:hypothetical protein